jgi:hypothetical protein
MDRWFVEGVERNLGVAHRRPAEVGPIRTVMARGCDALGWPPSRHPPQREGCTGSSLLRLRLPQRRAAQHEPLLRPRGLGVGGAQLFTGPTSTGCSSRAAGRWASRPPPPADGGCACARERGLPGGRRGADPPAAAQAGPVQPQRRGGQDTSRLHPSTGVSGLFDEGSRASATSRRATPATSSCARASCSSPPMPDVKRGRGAVPVVGQPLMQTLELLPRIASSPSCSATPTAKRPAVWRGSAASRSSPTGSRGRTASCCTWAWSAAWSCCAPRAPPLLPHAQCHAVVELADFDRYRKSLPAAADLSLVSYHRSGHLHDGTRSQGSVVGLDHQAHDVRALRRRRLPRAQRAWASTRS